MMSMNKCPNCFKSLKYLAPALSILMTACFGGGSPNAAAEGVPLKNAAPTASPAIDPTVETFLVQSGSGSKEQFIPAVISTDNTAVVLAQIDGIVVDLKADEGTQVAKDAVIARISDEGLRVQLRQSEIEVERLTIEARQYEEMIKVNRTELEQDQALAESGLTSARQVNRSRYKVNVSVDELERERLAVRVAQARVDAAKLELQKSVLKAPMAGVVTRRYARLGAGVIKGEKLFEVAQMSPLQVRFQLSSSEPALLRPGSAVNVSEAQGDRVLTRATVRRIDPIADAASNTLTFVADLTHTAGLVPGIAVNVQVPGRRSGTTYAIPRAAFPSASELRQGVAAPLFVVEGGRCSIRTVWIQEVGSEQVEISSGLMPGDHVVLSPPAQLKTGAAVSVKN